MNRQRLTLIPVQLPGSGHYYSIEYHTRSHRLTDLTNVQGKDGKLVIDGTEGLDFVSSEGYETLYDVSMQCIDSKALKKKTSYRRVNGFSDTDADSYSEKTKDARVTFAMRTEQDARRVVTAMKHAVMMNHGRKIPPPSPRKPDADKKPDPFDN